MESASRASAASAAAARVSVMAAATAARFLPQKSSSQEKSSVARP